MKALSLMRIGVWLIVLGLFVAPLSLVLARFCKSDEVLGVTPPNPLELIERPAFALLMRELAGKFDHVIVDSPAAAPIIRNTCNDI